MENSAIFRIFIAMVSGGVGATDGVTVGGTMAGVGVVVAMVAILGVFVGQLRLRCPCFPQLKHLPSLLYVSFSASVVAFRIVSTSMAFGLRGICVRDVFLLHVKGFVPGRAVWKGEEAFRDCTFSQFL